MDLFSKKDGHFFAVLCGALYALFAKIVIIVFGFINNILVARFYGAELVGVVSIVQTLLTLLSLVALLGLNQSILAIIPKYNTKNRYLAFPFMVKISFVVLLSSLIISMCSFGVLGFLGIEEDGSQLGLALLVGVFFVCAYALRTLFLSFYRAIEAVKFFTALQLVTPLVNCGVLICVIYFSYAEIWAVYARLFSAVSAIIFAMVGFYYFFQKVSASKAREQSTDNFRSLLKMSLPLCGVSLLVFSTNKISILIYGLFASEVDVGYYSVAVNTAILINVALGCVNSMVAPKFAELHVKGEGDLLFSVGKKTTKLICSATIPLTVILLCLGKYLLVLFYGESFEGAYLPMAILAVGNCLNAIAGPNDIFLQMTGGQSVLNKMMWVGFVISLVCYFPLISVWGSVGAAISVVVGQCVWNCLAHFYILKKYNNTLFLFAKK